MPTARTPLLCFPGYVCVFFFASREISLVPTSQACPPSSFRLLGVCKNGGGRPGPFYHVDDVSVYLDRQRVPDRKNMLEVFSYSCCPKCCSFKHSLSEKRITPGSKQRTGAQSADQNWMVGRPGNEGKRNEFLCSNSVTSFVLRPFLASFPDLF